MHPSDHEQRQMDIESGAAMDRRRRRAVSDTSDPLEILDAIDRERGDSLIGMIQANQVQRLRDEIVMLREKGATLVEGFAAIRAANAIADKARDEALEEAAQLCQARFKRPLDVEALNCARAIRALKDQSQP